jgi:hypothetical protein
MFRSERFLRLSKGWLESLSKAHGRQAWLGNVPTPKGLGLQPRRFVHEMAVDCLGQAQDYPSAGDLVGMTAKRKGEPRKALMGLRSGHRHITGPAAFVPVS